LEEDEASWCVEGLPEVEADEEPGGHHLSGLCDDDEGVCEPEAGEFPEVYSVGKELDGGEPVVGVEGVAELGEEGPGVASGDFEEEGFFEFIFAMYPEA
jgi:hypothetical protein